MSKHYLMVEPARFAGLKNILRRTPNHTPMHTSAGEFPTQRTLFPDTASCQGHRRKQRNHQQQVAFDIWEAETEGCTTLQIQEVKGYRPPACLDKKHTLDQLGINDLTF